MKKIVTTILFLLVAALGCSKGYEITKSVGDYTVNVRMDKSSPVVGDNHLTIEVKDATGNYVTDATIKVEYSMPAMQGMPAMNYSTEAMLHGTQYHATMNLSMAGSWNVALKITRSDTTNTVNFNVDAR